MTQLNSLKISLANFSNDTTRISEFISSKFTNLIFYPSIIEADIDYKDYCMQLQAIKKYTEQLTLNEDTKIIKEKIQEMPDISHPDFKYYTWGVHTYLLFILLPIGLVVWLNTYNNLSTLHDKLKDIKRASEGLLFMLKSLTN